MQRFVMVLVLALLSAPVTSFAQEAPNATVSTAAPERSGRWYGWQILIVDAIGDAMGVTAGLIQVSALGYVGLGVQVLGGPIVHFTRGRTGVAIFSMLMRLAWPAGGYGIGWAAAGGQGDRGTSGALLGASLSALAFTVFDVAALAFEDHPHATRRTSSTGITSGGLAPVQGGALVSVGGMF